MRQVLGDVAVATYVGLVLALMAFGVSIAALGAAVVALAR